MEGMARSAPDGGGQPASGSAGPAVREAVAGVADARAARALTALMAAVEGLVGLPTWPMSDRDVLAALEVTARLAACLDAARLRLVAEVDRRPGAVAGAPPGRASITFQTQRLNCSARSAARDAAAAHHLLPVQGIDGRHAPAQLPDLAASFAAGEVTREHVDVAVGCLQHVPARLVREHHAAIDQHFAQWSRQFNPTGTRRLAARVLAVIDPLGADRADREATDRRYLRRNTDTTGMLFGSFQLDPADATVLNAALDRYSKPATGTAQDDHGAPSAPLDTRTKAQRDADALVAIAQHALEAGGAAKPAPVQVLVMATPAQLASISDQPQPAGTPDQQGRSPSPDAPGASTRPDTPAAGASTAPSQAAPGLASTPRGPISRSALHRLACDAALRRVLLAPTGAVLDVGRRVRLATPAQRMALAVRDQGCCIPGCEMPPMACDAHHIVPWQAGGPTELENLALLCPRHHTAVHHGHWRLQHRNGVVWATPPPWLDRQRRPLRNTTHQAADQAHQLGQRLADEDDR